MPVSIRNVELGSVVTDTDLEMLRRQYSCWRAMTVHERGALAARLSDDVEQLAIAGIRMDRPDIGADDLRHEVVRRRYGRALADAAYRR